MLNNSCIYNKMFNFNNLFMKRMILLSLILMFSVHIAFANPDQVVGDGYIIEIYNGSKIPNVTYENRILTVEDISMDRAEITLDHNNGHASVLVHPKLYVKNENNFVEAVPYCLNKTVQKEVPRIIDCQPGELFDCALQESLGKTMIIDVEVPDTDNCFNSIEELENAYKFKVQHFSSYEVRDIIYTDYHTFNDSLTADNLTYYNYSETINKWKNRTKSFTHLHSWTNVSQAEFDINEITNVDKLRIGDVYSRGTGRGARGLAYNGTTWFTSPIANLLESAVEVWDSDWNLITNITVNVPPIGAGDACDFRDLELDPLNSNNLMVLCSETQYSYNWLRWVNLSTMQQYGPNWTLPDGFYQAAALTNNYIIVSRTAGATWDSRMFRFNRTDGTLIDNATAPGNRFFQGGWSNGTHAFFSRGDSYNDGPSYIMVCPEDNLSECTYYGWAPPQCEQPYLGQVEDASDLVFTDDWLAISWDWRTADGCENSVDFYYNRDFNLSTDFKVYGWNNTLLADYSDLGDTVDFSDDLKDFISNSCITGGEWQCLNPYTLRFEGTEGVVEIDNININISTAFDTLEECLLIFNETDNCCVVARDNYYEKLSGGSYEIGDDNCAVRIIGSNVTIDFNNVPFYVSSPDGAGLYMYSCNNSCFNDIYWNC